MKQRGVGVSKIVPIDKNRSKRLFNGIQLIFIIHPQNFIRRTGYICNQSGNVSSAQFYFNRSQIIHIDNKSRGQAGDLKPAPDGLRMFSVSKQLRHVIITCID